MPIVDADLPQFQAASMPEDDSSTTGGAISTTGMAEITDIAATDTVQGLSDGADTRDLTVYGRLATGAIDSETITLNGTTPVATTKQFERIMKAVLSTGSGTRTVTLRRTTGATLICTFPPNIVSQRRLFYDSSSNPSAQKIRYEKIFRKNAHATITLTSAAVKLTSDPANRYRIGCAPSVGDSATVTNRVTAPAGVTFVDDSVSQTVPGGNVIAGQAIGIWVEQNLPQNDSPHKNSVTVELSGSTT